MVVMMVMMVMMVVMMGDSKTLPLKFPLGTNREMMT